MNGACPKVFMLVGRGTRLDCILLPCRTLSLQNIPFPANKKTPSENKSGKSGFLTSVSSVPQALQAPGADRSLCAIGHFCRSRKRDIEPSCLGISTRCLMTSSSVSRPTTLCSGGSDAAMDIYKLVGRLLTRGWTSYVRTRNPDILTQSDFTGSFFGYVGKIWLRSRMSTDSGLIMSEEDHDDHAIFLKSYHAYSASQPATIDV